MSADMDLTCFGGPLNEQRRAIPIHHHLLLAAVKAKPGRYLAYSDPTTADLLRTVTYTVEKVAWHDVTACEPFGQHNDRCMWMARCLIAEGYPVHRITDALNAIGGMTRLLTL